jgi:4-hydroxybenzoyl-CoA thioesterase
MAAPFVSQVEVRFRHCDPAGIVFYPRYLELFDANTAYLFVSVGLPKPTLVKTYDIVGMPIVDVQAKFFMPSTYGDRITVESRVGEWRRSGLRVDHRLLKEGKVAVEGYESRVWAAKDPQRPGGIKTRPVPQEVIDRFNSAQ